MSSNSCIDENVIGALFEHRLSSEAVEEIDEHVARCTECRDLLCNMARLYASSSSSRAIVETVSMLDAPALGAAATLEAGEVAVRRLLAVIGCERQVGRLLGGKWRLDAVLGVGGMAEVYAATHHSNGRAAAIKVLRREWLARPNVVYRFLREGYVANRIAHPGVVTILDDGVTDDGVPFLVLERLDGQAISAHVRDRLPLATVLWIACEILDVLACAHEQQIVHRDIKPDNVFLTDQGAVKVLDFGIARTREPDTGASATQSGTLLGTPAYMPPEQARGTLGAIDARTDLWAVGATMFALLAGRPVRNEGTPNEMLGAAMTRPAPALASVASNVPVEVCRVVDRALAFEREERWPNARAMQGALREVLERLGRESAPAVTLSASLDARPRMRARSTASVFGAALLVAVTTFVALRPQPPRAHASAPAKIAREPEGLPTAAEPIVAPVGVATGSSSTFAKTLAAQGSKHLRRAPLRREPVEHAVPTSTPEPPPPPPEAHPLDRRD